MSGSNLDSLHYSCRTHREHRQQYSTSNYLSYLFEFQGGTYKFKMDAYFEGDPGAGSRNAARIAGYSNSHFDFGWFNNSNNGYWLGNQNSTTSSCTHSTFVVHNINGATTYNGGYFYVSRGYKSTPGSVAVALIGATTIVNIGLSSFTSVITSIAITVMTATLMVLEAEELAFTIEKEAQFLQQVYRNVG